MGEVTTVAPTQIDVREQDIDHLVAEDDLGLFGTGSSQNHEPGLLQGLGCHGANREIIFNHEHTDGACLEGCTRGLGGPAPARWDRDHAGALPSGVRLTNSELGGGVHKATRLPLSMVSGSLTIPSSPRLLNAVLRVTKTDELNTFTSLTRFQTGD
jgi:hypothetical protein